MFEVYLSQNNETNYVFVLDMIYSSIMSMKPIYFWMPVSIYTKDCISINVYAIIDQMASWDFVTQCTLIIRNSTLIEIVWNSTLFVLCLKQYFVRNSILIIRSRNPKQESAEWKNDIRFSKIRIVRFHYWKMFILS